MRRTTKRRLFSSGVVAAVVIGAAAYVTATVLPSSAATSANVWLTTPDRTNLLTQQAAVAFGGTGSGTVITVDPAKTYQSMVGFGASFTDSAAYNIFHSPQRDAVMTKLFDPAAGIGLSWVRQPIAASDYSRSFYTYDDGAGFSIAHDQDYILPLLTQARALNPQVTFMGTPWSAPARMKTNSALIGGSLKDASIGDYTDYLVKFAQAYRDAGVPIGYLSVQNEPKFSPPGYPGMLMTADQQARVINALAPKLAAAGLSTRILGYDHNWDDTTYAQSVNSAAGANVAGSAWHCYAGDPAAQSTVHNAQPAKDLFFTECSGTESSDTSKTFGDSLWWQGRNLAIGATRNWAKTVTTWNMALNAQHGPVIGSCTNCTGVVTTDGGSVSYNAEYYVLGHLSKFVKPGAVRIDSTAVAQGGIENVAFRNPDGTIALVTVNTGGAQDFQVSFQGQKFGYRLPAGSMATFTWPGGGATTPPATTPPTTTPPTTTPPATTPPASGVKLVGAGGKCLDVTGSSAANGTLPQVWDCFGDANQLWQHPADTTLRSLGKCLDVKDNLTTDGAAVQMWDCFGGPNQQWTYTAGHDLVNVASGKCLDIKDAATTNGAKLQIWTCTGAANQKWAGL
ncbi:ricin-type beta-trefoil lectin domain protein [Winogradskya humida]|uniref:Glucosylceramidase n=1 Tax=Winogradskya humida TaxID=113566 RepID=A0ABQ3ZYL5_9ACTN|nr:ricin-type beta-trefoil lectin domain protein [Actinoplanes humidus]GIE23745.1 glucosylceramidase [Actinoplanes humidus]